MSAPRYPVLLAAVEVIAGLNDTIVIDEAGNPTTCTIEPGTYFLRGDGEDDDLIRAVEAALISDAGVVGFQPGDMRIEFDVDAAGRAAQVHIEPDDISAWTLKTTGTFPLALLGFVEEQSAVDKSGVHSTHTPSCVWVSPQPFVTREPRPRRPATTQHETPERGVVYTFTAADTRRDRVLQLAHIIGARALRERNATDPAASFESWWELANDGRDVELHLARIAEGTTLEALTSDALTLLCTGVLTGDSLAGLPLTQSALSPPRYAGDVRFIELSVPPPLPPPTLSYADQEVEVDDVAALSPTTSGYIDRYSYTGTLPPGISFDTTTGQFTGTYTTEGVYSVTVTAHGPGGTASDVVTFTVSASGSGFDGGELVTASIYDALEVVATAADTTVQTESDSLIAGGDDHGPYTWARATGPLVLDSEEAWDDVLGAGHDDLRPALVYVDGDVTVSHDPARRRPFVAFRVTGTLTLNSDVNGLGANHSTSGSNKPSTRILWRTGTYGGVTDPSVPTTGGSGGSGAVGTGQPGAAGAAGVGGGTGGGGSGGHAGTLGGVSGSGAAGTSYGGGSGGGAVQQNQATTTTAADAEPNGGSGGAGIVQYTAGARGAGGGAGNPPGAPATAGAGSADPGGDGTGGVLYVVAGAIAGTGSIVCDGADGGDGYASSGAGGGASGGGHCTVQTDDGAAWGGVASANGGAGGAASGASVGGNGGLGWAAVLPATEDS